MIIKVAFGAKGVLRPGGEESSFPAAEDTGPDNPVKGAGPESQIVAIRTVLEKRIPFASHSFLEIGQRVRVRGGTLDGIEGILTRFNGSDRLVISVNTIQRSLSVSVEGYQVEPVGAGSRLNFNPLFSPSLA